MKIKKRREGENNRRTMLEHDFRYFHIIHERSVSTAVIYQFPSFCFKIHHGLDSMSTLIEISHIVCDEKID